jgi:hypothetical protein
MQAAGQRLRAVLHGTPLRPPEVHAPQPVADGEESDVATAA